MFERKHQYKEDAARLQEEFWDTSDRLNDLQKLSNETNNQMSKTINVLQEERAALVSNIWAPNPPKSNQKSLHTTLVHTDCI